MSKDINYRPSGELQGDTKDLPDRGTGTGVTDTYGADIGPDAQNRMGRMKDCTESDPAGTQGKDMPSAEGLKQ